MTKVVGYVAADGDRDRIVMFRMVMTEVVVLCVSLFAIMYFRVSMGLSRGALCVGLCSMIIDMPELYRGETVLLDRHWY